MCVHTTLRGGESLWSALAEWFGRVGPAEQASMTRIIYTVAGCLHFRMPPRRIGCPSSTIVSNAALAWFSIFAFGNDQPNPGVSSSPNYGSSDILPDKIYRTLCSFQSRLVCTVLRGVTKSPVCDCLRVWFQANGRPSNLGQPRD